MTKQQQDDSTLLGDILVAIASLQDELDIARVTRDAAIRSARARGASLGQIAKAAGLTRQGIAKILQRQPS